MDPADWSFLLPLLYLGGLHFTLFFRPGPRNLQLDALSRFSSPDQETEEDSANIHPPTRFIAAAQWEVSKTQHNHQDPGTGPAVSLPVYSQVVQWAHYQTNLPSWNQEDSLYCFYSFMFQCHTQFEILYLKNFE